MSSTSQAPYQLFKSFFTIKSLKNIYNEEFRKNKTKGIDRLSGIQFKKQEELQIKVIKRKCLEGDYKFSPYLELLKSKGRDSTPRVIAIPTVRDRIVLYALKEILSQTFSECVPRKLANTHIHDIDKYMKNNRIYSEIGIYRTDIVNFYGSIDRNILLTKLRKKIKSHKIINLIKTAIETPVVPKHYNRKDLVKYREKSTGIPQGLSISNILASIYLHEFDITVGNSDCIDVYHRYVDDILTFTKKETINEAENLIKKEIDSLALKLNEKEEKTFKKSGEQEFEYLGYRFEFPKITIRKSTLQNFIHSITAKFSKYTHNKRKQLKKLEKKKYGVNNVDKLKEVFISELNEKITGSIDGNKKYGWVFYFSAINDVKILYTIDAIIVNLFKRLDDFGGVAPTNLKKISRAYYEAKFNPMSGYIHNYSNYKDNDKKKEFLIQRGHIDPFYPYTEEEIDELFENCKKKNLSELEKDDALLY